MVLKKPSLAALWLLTITQQINVAFYLLLYFHIRVHIKRLKTRMLLSVKINCQCVIANRT